jgi:hypothetical protein
VRQFDARQTFLQENKKATACPCHHPVGSLPPPHAVRGEERRRPAESGAWDATTNAAGARDAATTAGARDAAATAGALGAATTAGAQDAATNAAGAREADTVAGAQEATTNAECREDDAARGSGGGRSGCHAA